MKYCICAIIKDERRYLEEWIIHNLGIGFDAIHLYEDYGSESHKDITGKYDEVFLHSYNEVEISDYSERDKKQIDLFNYFVKTYRNEYDWCAFIDPDEYIRFEEGWNLERLCQEFADVNGVMLNQKTFNASGHINRPIGGVQENYTEWMSYKKYKFRMKTIVNLKKDVQFKGVHRVQGALFTDNTNRLDQSPIYKKAWYDHYYTKSWEDWCDRFKRGDVCPNNVKPAEFFEYNKLVKCDDLLLGLAKKMTLSREAMIAPLSNTLYGGLISKCALSTFSKLSAIHCKDNIISEQIISYYKGIHNIYLGKENETHKVVVVWREPIKRWLSFYQNKIIDHHDGSPYVDCLNWFGKSVEEVLTLCENIIYSAPYQEVDGHFRRQSDWYKMMGRIDYIVPIEYLDDFLLSQGINPIEHQNSSGSYSITLSALQKKRLMELYKEDYYIINSNKLWKP